MEQIGRNLDDEVGGLDHIPVHGEFEITHFSGDGDVLHHSLNKNLVVNVGKAYIPGLVTGFASPYAPFTYIQIGLANNTPAVTDTHLFSPYMEGLATCSYGADFKAILDYIFTFSEEQTILEAGTFNGTIGSVPEPIMLNRGTFSGRDVIPGDRLEVKWRDTFG